MRKLRLKKRNSLALLFVSCLIGCSGPQTEKSNQSEDENIIDINVSEESINDKQHHTGPSYYDDTKNNGITVNSSQTSSTKKKPNIRVYVENSGSMYGYVGTGVGSDFRNMVYNYLTDINSGIFDSLHLNFVNSSIIPRGSSIDDFVRRLEPSTFKVSGGNSGTTDIAEIIKRVFPSENVV